MIWLLWEKSLVVPPKLSMQVQCDSEIPFVCICPREMIACFQSMYMNIHSSIIHNS